MAVVRRLKDALPSDLVREELGILTSFIQQQRFRSVEELHDCIEQLFVEMLNELLIQLPNAIYKEIIECNPEDYEKGHHLCIVVCVVRLSTVLAFGTFLTRLDDSLCASGGRDGVTLLWDLAEGKKLYSLDVGAIINAKGVVTNIVGGLTILYRAHVVDTILTILTILTCTKSSGLVGADILKPNKRDYKAIKEVKEFVHVEEADLNDWVLKKGMDDMKRWIESVNQTKASTNHHLFQLLSKSSFNIPRGLYNEFAQK
ncbi:hypothetical protein Sjap_008414 [Stephania japonica]|uniref:Uncharacterized protein n=1 Tax=Stephania japonica TaxID=461633 RepID=A0AAP0JRR0_9MAGN